MKDQGLIKTTSLPTRTFRIARILVIAFILLVVIKFLVTLVLFPRYLAINPVLEPVGGWTPEQTVSALMMLGLPPTASSWLNMALITLSTLIYCTVGLVILLRKTGDWFALYLALVFVLFSTSANHTNNVVIHFYPGLRTPIELAGNLAWPMFFILFYLFPNGRFIPWWSKWFMLFFLGMTVLGTFSPEWGNSIPFVFFGLVFIFTGIGGQIYRYGRYSNAIQRQQTKLVVFAVVSMVVIALGSLLLASLDLFPDLRMQMLVEIVRSSVTLLAMSLFPVSIAVAILRYRLWDIDILVRRTITYSLLTALIVLLYAGSVVLLQAVFGRSIGAQSPLLVVASTLLIAALFNPLRRRIQDGVDRRFYRQKYDGEQVLAAFSANLRDEVDLDHLRATILEVVGETVQPTRASLWLRK